MSNAIESIQTSLDASIEAVAHELAAHQPGDYVGVVFATNRHANPETGAYEDSPQWYAYTFPDRTALRDWYEDWVGAPALYHYLHMFDRSYPENVHASPVHVSGAFDSLAAIVAAHDAFYDARRATASPALRAWIEHEWAPWLDRWHQITDDGGALGEPLMHQVSQSLSQLRDGARAAGLPVPEISRFASLSAPTVHLGYPHAPAPASSIESEIDHETDNRFWATYGYNVGRRLDRHNPNDAKMIPKWIAIRYHVALERGHAADPDQPFFAQDHTKEAPMRHASSISVSGGDCGSKSFTGVTSQVLDRIFARLHEKGADVTGNNPWIVITHDHGVELSGTWSAATGVLTLEVTDSDFIAPCSRVWDALEDMLSDVGAHPVVSGAIVGRGGGGGGGGRGYDISRRASQNFGGNDTSIAQIVNDPNAANDATLTELAPIVAGFYGDVACAGWWSSLTHAVSSTVHGAVHGVESAAKGVAGTVGHTLVALKGPISLAAGAAATAYLGPTAGPMAAQLTGSLIDATAGSGDAKQVAQQVVQQATQAAQTNPQVAQALAVAHKAVAQTTAGYHVAQTLANAASGNADAKAQIQELMTAANAGDPAAQALANVASDVTDAADANAVVQGAVEDLRTRGSHAAHDAEPHVGPYFGIEFRVDAPDTWMPFHSLDDASDWLAGQAHAPHLYAAIYDGTDPTFPAPISESLGDHAETHVSGVVLPMLFAGGAGFAAGAYFWPALREKLAAWRGKAA